MKRAFKVGRTGNLPPEEARVDGRLAVGDGLTDWSAPVCQEG